MTLTLTAWWKKLDDETRSLAGIFGDINYPASLTVPYTNVKADKEMTPWEAVHAMASLGSAIETNVMSGEGIASNIATAAKNLGDPIPNSPRHLPAITDEKSLLLALVYYRAQCRFQEIQSSNSWVQNGALGKPGVQKNKEGVAKEAEVLRVKIKNYCASNQEIAAAAELKFKQLFPQENEVGSEFFKAKNFMDSYTDFARQLIGSLVEDINEESHTELHNKTLDKTQAIIKTLEEIEEELQYLYLCKKLQEFLTDNVKKSSEATFERFKSSLPASYQTSEVAKQLWDAAELQANQGKKYLEMAAEGWNNRMPNLVQNFMNSRYNPMAYIPGALGVDENARFERFRGQFSAFVSSKIDASSQTLYEKTGISTDDFKTASSQNILDSIEMNHKLILEIERLKTSLQSYVQETSKDNIVKFSTSIFFGWLTKWFAESKLTKSLVYDNIHYMNLAQKYAQQLDKIKEIKDEKTQGEALGKLKETMHQEIDNVRDESRYLFFKEDRKLAHKKLSNIVDGIKNEDDISTIQPVRK